MAFKIYLYAIFILCALITKNAQAQILRCFSCGFSSVDTDRSCLTITNSTPSVICPYAYCTIMRQEFVDPSAEIASFLRGCEQSPDFLNHEVVDSTFRTFYRACTSSLCNIGNGIQPISGGNLHPSPQDQGPNLLVPGTGNAANKLQINAFTLATFLLLYKILF